MAEEVLVNFHFPFLIIAVIIGFQISVYFLYLYISKRKDNLKLNKILLAYGGLFYFLIVSVLIRTIYNYLIEDPALKAIVYQLSLVSITIAAIVFLYIMSGDGFNSLINTKISKFLLILSIIFSTIVFFNKDSNLQIILSMIALSIAAVYIVVFHYKLLTLSSGVIKNRLTLITIGNFIMVAGITLEADEFIYFLSYEAQIIIMIASVPLFVIGELMIFLGIFRFPAFLEFDWKEHIYSLYVIENENFSILYQHEFEDKREIKQYQELADSLIKGVLGIDKIVSALGTSDKQIERITQGDLILLISSGSLKPVSIVYILIVDKDMESYPYFLSEIKNKFEFYFSEVLFELESIKGHEDLVFSGFDLAVKKLLKL